MSGMDAKWLSVVKYISVFGVSTGLNPDFGTEWEGVPMGIPYVVVSNADNMVPVHFYLDGI